jgi:anthranilate phosphoribosyltransferase
VADVRRLGLIGGALQALGTTHSLIVHGAPGLDEVSPLGSTMVLELVDGEARSWSLEPERLGIPAVPDSDLAGAEPADNARVVMEVLAGRGRPGAIAAVTMNAAAAIYVSGLAADFPAALALAREALRDGAGRRALEKLRTVSGRAAGKG